MCYIACVAVSTLDSPAVDPRSNSGPGKILMSENLRLSQTVTGSRLTGYIVNVMRFPVIEKLMVRGSQVALKHVIHDMVTRTLVIKLRRRAIKRWVPCGDTERRLKIPHSAKVECRFQGNSRGMPIR